MALVRQRVEFMGQVPLLKRLTEEEREDLASELSVQRFSRGDEIIVQGDGGSTMFIIEEGTATAFVEGVQVPGKPPGEVHRYENPGDFFGELALITNQPRKATVVATSAVLALTLGKESFERIVGNVGEKMEEARRRLRAASYVKGRRDYKRLFQYYNRSKSGTLDWGEFRALIRKDGRMTAAMMTDRELRTLFCLVDKEGNGCIDQKEFILFLGVAGEDDQEPVEKDEALSPEEMGRRLELLSTVKMLGSLNEKEQRALARALIVQQYAADEDVITAGDAGTEMFIVQEGELEAISPDGTQVWQEYAAGSSFGAIWRPIL
jgi:cAMP-dependent protein kinase regulator